MRDPQVPDPRRGIQGRFRGQSDVVGVAMMLGVTVLALGMLTATIGGVVQSNAAGANAARVANDFEDALRPVESTGVHRGRISFTEGELVVVERQLRVLDANGVVQTVDVDALRFESGDNRVTFLAGAIVRGTGDGVRLTTAPPLTASAGSGGVLIVGAPKLSAPAMSVAGNGRQGVELASNVTHERRSLGSDTWRVAVETATPQAWESFFESADGVSDIARTDFDADGIESVVATFEGSRTAYLVVHDMQLSIDGESTSQGSEDGEDAVADEADGETTDSRRRSTHDG